ncbi:MAG: hypothetical protein R6T85_12745 [Egibacteraceae bacterium]
MGNLTSDWTQAGAYDIILSHTDSQLQIMGSSGTYYGTLDAGALTAARSYTLPNATGTIALTSDIPGSQNVFTTFDVPSGTDPVADDPDDTLTFTAGSNLTITGNATTDTIDFAVTGLDNYQYWTAQDGDTTTYNIDSQDTLQFAEGTGIDVNFTGDDVLTIAHLTGDGYSHVPSGGASAQVLQYTSAGTAKWVTVSGDLAIADGGAMTIQPNSVALTGH